MTESAYADDAAFLFPSREIAERDTPRIMKHFAEWGMEVHSGITETPDTKGKTSKTELLFVAKTSYTEPSTRDDTNIFLIFLRKDASYQPTTNSATWDQSSTTISGNQKTLTTVQKRPLKPSEPYEEVSSHPNQHPSK